jgi:3-deoxy-manno-octulosonate cytidylyltransferase (CMP-KDO synthetase)
VLQMTHERAIVDDREKEVGVSLKPLIIIPVRLGSTRLPQKPLADIVGKPMIQHVWERAVEADVAPVVVATDHESIADIIYSLGGTVIMTDPDLPSGSDRVNAATQIFDPQKHYNVIINLQGDLPNVSPQTIRAVMKPLENESFAVATLAAVITDQEELTNRNVVKIALSSSSGRGAQALYFSRHSIPFGPGPHYHHIGIYAFRRAVLEQFVAMPPSPLEIQEKLEQLRLLESGVTFGVELVSSIPVSVDTQADLLRARTLLAA